MRQAKTDRRSLRTRQLLTQAVVELMGSKRYDAITVQEIAEQANVGRSTFYAHFADKDDLLVDGVRRMLVALDTAAPEPTGRGARLYPTLALFRHVGAQADMYRTMAKGRALPHCRMSSPRCSPTASPREPHPTTPPQSHYRCSPP